jgi:hypothetical protein
MVSRISEYEQGRDEGVKDRPCVTIVAIEDDNGTPMVAVAPITHSMPTAPEAAVEIPAATKRRLGLDDARSWGVVSEVACATKIDAIPPSVERRIHA